MFNNYLKYYMYNSKNKIMHWSKIIPEKLRNQFSNSKNESPQKR
jgi:hypothetical protein